MRIRNNRQHPVALESGIVLAAAGTEGSIRDNVTLTPEEQKRLVDTGLFLVLEVDAAPAVDMPAIDRSKEKK